MTNLTELQQIGRAKNAVSMFLDKKLVVPKIYLDADWDGNRLDILAIDRAGVGDAYAVRLMPPQTMPGGWDCDAAFQQAISEAYENLPLMLSLPCQYRYIGILSITEQPFRGVPSTAFKTSTFPEDGVGRVGLFQIDLLADVPRVEEVIRAERFRSTKHILELTDNFVMSHTADAEYRDPIYDQEVSA